MKKFTHTLLIPALILILASAGSVRAATQAEINTAVEQGLAWLATQQFAGGSFLNTSNSYVTIGATGLAVTVFTHHALETDQDPFDPTYAYSTQVVNGLNYIFDEAIRDVGNQRVHWGISKMYCVGPNLMAITASGQKDRTVDRPGSAVDGMTYEELAQEILNFAKATQGQANDELGFWEYRGPTRFGDMSSTGWMALGLGYASHNFDMVLDPDMMDLLRQGIEDGQYTGNPENPADPRYGGFGYTSSGNPPYSRWVNLYKAGHLLYIQELLGYAQSAPSVQRVLEHIEAHWDKPNSGRSGYPGVVNGQHDMGWQGGEWTPGDPPPSPLPSYIASAAMMKAFLAWGMPTIGGVDWYEAISDRIVGLQNAEGSWDQGGYPSHYTELSTIWALLTLLRAVPASGSITDVTLTSAVFLANAEMTGTGYYVLVTRGAPIPTKAEIMAGDAAGGGAPVTSGFGAVTEDEERRFPLAGLTPDTRYDLYFVAKDGTAVGTTVRVQFATLGAGSMIDVTDLLTSTAVEWRLDRDSGALQATYLLSYPQGEGAVGKPELHSAFWMAVPDSATWFLAQKDGEIDGLPYTDVTAQVEASLEAAYGRTVMLPGDSARFTVDIYSMDRSIPPIDALYALWADPPPIPGDRNGDGKIDDQELLTAVDEWKAGRLGDFQLIGVVDRWRDGGE